MMRDGIGRATGLSLADREPLGRLPEPYPSFF